MVPQDLRHQLERREVDGGAQGGRGRPPDLDPLEEADGEVTPAGTPLDNTGLLVEVEMGEDGFACYVDEKSPPLDVGG